MSSGVHVTEFKALKSCDECEYSGPVDAWFDPELLAGGWECPDCHRENVRSS